MACDTAVNIDLHIHSTASDGTLSPAEIVRMALEIRLGAISITDHDTVEGSEAALASGIPDSLQFLTGVEVSAEPPPSYNAPGSFHILGYAFRLDDPVMNRTFIKLRESRENRNPQIIAKLRDMGFDLSIDEAAAFGDGQISRPHIAMLMKAKGFVKSIDEAFDSFLGAGRPAYVKRYHTGCADTIAMIKDAGGIAVLAHPGLLNFSDNQEFEQLIRELIDMGIGGIEAYYPEHSDRRKAFFLDTARRFDLLATGGTDFHGSVKPGTRMGSANGDFRVPYAVYEQLIHMT